MSSFLRQIFLNATTRILTLIFLSLALLCLFFILSGYYTQRQITQEDELSKLEAIANTTGLLIDGEVIFELAEKYPNKDDITTSNQDSSYLEVHNLLSRVKKVNNFETDIYLLFVEKGEMLFSITSGERPYYRHKYKFAPRELTSQWAVGGTLKPYEDENGSWLSAFSPVRNKRGIVSAVIMVDSKFDAYIEKNNRRFFFYILITLAGLVFIGVILYLQTKKILVKEDKLKTDIEESRGLLEIAHRESMSSLYYAKQIQQSIFPSPEKIKNLIGENVVINKPLHVVSGDFYWIAEVDDEVILVTADCTGHGVPGAFMSIIGTNLLKDIVRNKFITDPGKILEKLNEGILSTLYDENKKSSFRDGMDASVVRVNKVKNEISFAGAYRPLVFISEKKMSVKKGARRGLGASSFNSDEFVTETFNYNKGDFIYMFSDGIVDQFGGPRNKKFKMSQLIKILKENQDKPISEQGRVIKQKLTQWMGDTPQIDDILLIGVELP